MATAAFRRFQKLVLDDEEACSQLERVETWEPFVALARELAAERGVKLGPDDLEAARREALASWRTRWGPA